MAITPIGVRAAALVAGALLLTVLAGCGDNGSAIVSSDGGGQPATTAVAPAATSPTTVAPQPASTVPVTTTPPEPAVTFPPSSPGRDGPVVYQLDPLVPGGHQASIKGRLSIDQKACLRIGSRGVVWPAETQWDHETSEVVLADGQRLAVGRNLQGVGGYFDGKFVEDLGMSALEYKLGAEVAAHLNQCYGTGEIAVLNNSLGAVGIAN